MPLHLVPDLGIHGPQETRLSKHPSHLESLHIWPFGLHPSLKTLAHSISTLKPPDLSFM